MSLFHSNVANEIVMEKAMQSSSDGIVQSWRKPLETNVR